LSRAVVLNEKRVERAEAFRDTHEFWLGLGKTTVWDYDMDPPDLTGDEIEVEELFGYIISKIEVEEGVFKNYAHVTRDSNGEILYRDRKYRMVDDADIYTENAYHLLFQITLPIDEFTDVDKYRQAGLFLNLQPATGYEDEDILAPNEVEDSGEFYALSNFRPIERIPDRFDRVMVILSF